MPLIRRLALLLSTTALAGPALSPTALAETIQMAPLQVEGGAVAQPAADGYQARRTSTATKTDTPLVDVPQSVTVVTREALEDQGAHGMAEAVRYVPGVTAGQGEGNRDQMVIRGTSSTADFFSNGIRDDSQVFRDTYNLERLEVLKGPNAMVFGRGGGGGVINRVIKQADGSPVRSISMQGGMFNTKRLSGDLGQAVTDTLALRVNGLIENSDSFRDEVHLQRQGINPTMALKVADRTKVTLGYEFFNDDRTADRGIPSMGGRPFKTDEGKFFGNPDLSYAESKQHTVDAAIEHEFAKGLTLVNRTRLQTTDKEYQNVYASGEAIAAGTYTLGAYRNGTQRENLFNQTDLTSEFATGAVKHTLLTGAELGRQSTDNFRQTGYFNGSATSLAWSSSSPTNWTTPVAWRQSASDGNASTTVAVAALYAQDQIELDEHWQVIAGLRFDQFDLDYTNNRTGQQMGRVDALWSPRLGVVFKPLKELSLYTSYSVSYLPSSGEQFGSLTVSQSTLKPEMFTNLELGAKWDLRPDLSLTTAVYQLDRENNIATAPGTTTSVQMGAQRTLGFEVGANGRITRDWQVAGGYAYQDASYAEATATVAAGKAIALVPAHTFSLWNKYQFDTTWAAGLGAIYQSSMAASSDNTVTLPGFARFDAAVYANITDSVRAQLNVQNLLDREYYGTANNNNNISPGAPRTVMLTLTSDF